MTAEATASDFIFLAVVFSRPFQFRLSLVVPNLFLFVIYRLLRRQSSVNYLTVGAIVVVQA